MPNRAFRPKILLPLRSILVNLVPGRVCVATGPVRESKQASRDCLTGERTGHVNAESGWYPDSSRIGTERYWEGDAWTEESRWPGTHPGTSPVPADLPAPGSVREAEMHESTVGFWLPPTDWLVPARAEAAPPRRQRRKGRRRAVR
jgi:hypothetical protein